MARTLIEELKRKVGDLAETDVEAAAATLSAGDVVANVHAFVRGRIAFDPYPGCLRGAVGTLWERAGNALDRALLTAALLAEHGFEAELTIGAVTDEQARARVDDFLARVVPPREPQALTSGVPETELVAIRGVMDGVVRAHDAAYTSVRERYAEMILALQADVARADLAAAEERLGDWAWETRQRLRITVDGPRAVLDEDQRNVDAVMRPLLERRDRLMRRLEVDPIADLPRWAATQYTELARVWTNALATFLARWFPGTAGEIAADLEAFALREMERRIDRDTETALDAIVVSLERAGIAVGRDPRKDMLRWARATAVVRCRKGDAAWRYLDLDAASPSDTPPPADVAWTGRPADLPDEELHRITLSARLEVLGGGVFRDEILLTHTLRAADVAAKMVRFALVPKVGSAESTWGSTLSSVLTGVATREYVPTLSVGGRTVRGRALSINKLVGGISLALGDAPDLAEPTACWLEATLQGPDGSRVLPRRELFDRYGVARRPPSGAPDPVEEVGGIPRFALGGIAFMVLTGTHMPERLLHEPMARFFDLIGSDVPRGPDPTPTTLPKLIGAWAESATSSLLVEEMTDSPPDDVREVALLDAAFQRALSDGWALMAQQRLRTYAHWSSPSSPSVRVWRAEPGIIAAIEEIGDRGPRIGIDLWSDVRTVAGARSARDVLRESVRLSIVEGELLRRVQPAPTRSAAESFLDAVAQGRAIAASTTVDPFGGLSAVSQGRIRERLAGGAIIVAPRTFDGDASFWMIDAAGHAVAVGADGRHQTLGEYLALLNVSVFVVVICTVGATNHATCFVCLLILVTLLAIMLYAAIGSPLMVALANAILNYATQINGATIVGIITALLVVVFADGDIGEVIRRIMRGIRDASDVATVCMAGF